MANSINLKIKVDDDGSLSIIGSEAKKAAAETDKLGTSTDELSKKRNRYNKLEKGTAQLGANTTKSFAKQSQTVGSGLVPAYAVLASNVFALSAAYNFFKRAADVKLLEQSQVAFAEKTGTALGSVTQRLREASDGLLGFREAGEAAAIGLAKGFSPSQLEDLAEGARKASTALGRDFQDSFDRLIRGASKAEPELLDELGITLRLEEATQRYADAIGRNRDELNAAQRSQAVLIETQRQLNELFGDVDGATNPFVKLSKTLEDIIKSATQFILPVFEGIANILNKSGAAAVAAFGLLALSIGKAALPMDAIKEKFGDIETASKEKLDNAKGALRDFQADIEKTNKKLDDAKVASAKSVARGILKEGDKAGGSALVQKVAKGQELTPQQKGQLKKMLKDAEAQYKQSGAILKNTFQGVNIDMVRSLKLSLAKMDQSNVGFFKRAGLMWDKAGLKARIYFQTIKNFGTKTFLAAGKAAAFMGKQMDRAMRLAGVVGILIMIKELVMAVVNSPFSIIRSVAAGIDTVLNFVAKGINYIAPGFFGFIDSFLNGWRTVVKSVKMMFSDMISTVLGGLDSFVNDIVDKINGFISSLNAFTGKDFGLIEFSSNLQGSFAGFGQGAIEVSNLAGEFKPLNTESSTFVQMLEESSFGKFLKGFQDGRQATAASNEALNSYIDNLDVLKESLSNVVAGMSEETDAAKKGLSVAKALQSMQVSSALSAINKKRLGGFDENDGLTDSETLGFVMNAKDREEATRALMEALEGLGSVSESYQRAVQNMNFEELERLEAAASAAVSGSSTLKTGIDEIGTQLRDTLGGGDILGAIRNLEELKRTSEDTSNAFTTLGQNEAAIKALKDYNEALKATGMTADEFLAKLYAIDIAQRALNIAETAASFTSGSLATSLNLQNSIRADQIRLMTIEMQLKTNLEVADREKLEREKQLLQIKTQLAGAQLRLNAAQQIGSRIGSSSLPGAFAGQQARDAAGAAVQNAQNVLEGLRQRISDGEDLTKELEAAQAALQIAQAQNIQVSISTAISTFDNLAEDFRKLGPEGELMAAMSSGIANIAETFTSAFQIIGTEGASAADKIMAGMSAAMSIIQTIGSVQKAASEQRVRALDQEIEAEKKRDGKSKQSLAKISQLEKKKDAEKRKAFEADKKMKIAQTIMATATGAMEAYKAMVGIPYVGPAIAAAAAAVVVAMGAQQLATIQSMTYNGGGGSVSASGPQTITAGQRRDSVDLAKSRSARGELGYFRGESGTGGPEAFTPAFSGYRNRAEGGNTAFMVGEQGPELFVPEIPGRIVPNDDITPMTSTNVSFNINTIDASGVEDLLVEQRGNIIGMIRQAANSYGQDFVEGVDTSVFTPSAGGVNRY